MFDTVQNGIEVIDEYPIAGLGIVVALAALAFVVVSAVFGGRVEPVSTVIFAVVFAAVYGAATLYLQRQN